MSRVRVVTANTEQPEAGFAETARAVLERALASGAVVLGVIWETPAGIEWDTVPSSDALAEGLVSRWVHGMLPEEEE